MKSILAAIAVVVIAGELIDGQTPTRSQTSSAGPLAHSCGVPASPPQANGGRGLQPIYPPGQYPVALPAVSLLGARNDLPNPYQSGIDWGQLPEGRRWGSTASVVAAP